MDNFIEQPQEQKIYEQNIVWKGRTNKRNPVEVLKIYKKQLLQKSNKGSQSNSYLDYLLSLKNQTNSEADIQNEEVNSFPKVIPLEKTDILKKDENNNIDIFHSQIFLPNQFNTFRRKNNQRKLHKSQRLKIKSVDAKSSLSLKKLQPIKQRTGRRKLTPKNLHGKQSYLSERSNNLLEVFVKSLSKNINQRTGQQIKALRSYLVKNNELISRLPQKICLCLLKVSSFHRYAPNSNIYKLRQQKQSVYFLLEGVIHLSNPVLQLKKLAYTGEIFGQEMILANVAALESIEAVTKCIVMKLAKEEWQILEDESFRMNFSNEYQILCNYIKHSYEQKVKYRNQKYLFHPN